MTMACWIACKKIRSAYSVLSVKIHFFLQRMLHTGVTNLVARSQALGLIYERCLEDDIS